MPTENPFQPPQTMKTAPIVRQSETDEPTFLNRDFRLNLRRQDNLVQAICIAAFLIAGVLSGAIVAVVSPEVPLFGGAILGGVAGLVLGFLLGGFAPMIYRSYQSKNRQSDED